MTNVRFWSIGTAALLLPAIAALMGAASGCSSDSDDGDAGTNDSGVKDSASADTSVDSGSSPASFCTQAEFDANDHTGTNGADVSLGTKDGSFVYVNNCVKIKVGQKVNFSMSASSSTFASHPLTPVASVPTNPIPLTNTGGDVSVTFNQAGTFGYMCEFHSTMKGDVQVVP